ncbi:hypothetical protein BGZ94_000083 [Podila epigama]|nr:hypothetical protein BGZ94_000083 [Podila epigama]
MSDGIDKNPKMLENDILGPSQTHAPAAEVSCADCRIERRLRKCSIEEISASGGSDVGRLMKFDALKINFLEVYIPA